MSKLILGILASGSGSNCRAIHKAITDGLCKAQIGVIISNHAEAGVLQYARENHIPAFHIASDQFSEISEFHTAVENCLSQHQVNLVVLAGYMKKIGKPILDIYQNRIINIHPALLPAFGGKGMYGHHVHQAVLDYGAKITGITIHFVDPEYDHGKIILQKAVEVMENDTVESLSTRVLKAEHETYYKAINLFANETN